jgi:hypothetical protein
MLDECKGDKFYEILAFFSNVVLKKVLTARHGGERDAAVARNLATAPMLSADQQRSLLPLAIAHKAALVNVLKRKDEKRKKFTEFEGLLDKKAEDVNRRIRKRNDTPRAQRPAVSQKEADTVKKQLKDNWIGNQKWLDIMLHGDHVQAEDAFLISRFDKVWHMVEKGRKLEDVAPETGLLENLQSRVQEQQDRLQKWKTFHAELRRDESEKAKSTGSKGPVPVKEFKFDDHSQYQLPSLKHKKDETMIKRPAMQSRYEEILYEMKAGLFRASKARTNPITTIVPRRRTSSVKPSRPPSRPKMTTRSESMKDAPAIPVKPVKLQSPARQHSLAHVPVLPRPSRHVPTVATPTDSEATLIGHTSTLRSAPPISDPVDSPAEAPHEHRPAPKPSPPTPDPIDEAYTPEPVEETFALEPTENITSQPPQRSVSPSPAYPSEPPIPVFEPPTLTTEEALADQIINSIGAATPSPIKKPQPRMSMSLIERTRMSMARTTSFESLPGSPDLPMPPPPIPSIAEEVEVGDRRATLLERTKLSMMAMESKPRLSREEREKKEKNERRSTSGRQSLFPVNQFDTPRNRKSFELLEQVKLETLERTPTEVLFSDEVDYDRVFKSRPRIATSPVWGPGGEEEEDVDGVTGIDLGDVDQDDDDEEGVTMSWQDSPSQKRGVRY